MSFAQLPSYPPFDVHSEGVATRWGKWISRLRNNLFVAYDITDEHKRKALMLTYGGNDLNDIVESLPLSEVTPQGGDESPFEKLVLALDNHFNPRANIELERYSFRHMSQTSDKIDDFYNSLKVQATLCHFASEDEEIKSQLISGCKQSRVRERGLSCPSMTLLDLLNFARTLEMSQAFSQKLSITQESVQRVGYTHSSRHQSHRPRFRASQSRNAMSAKPNYNHTTTPKQPHGYHNHLTSTVAKCRNCGGNWPHPQGQQQCPAFNKSCRSCGKMHHFASMCRSKPTSQGRHRVHALEFQNQSHNIDADEQVETDYYIFAFGPKSGLPHFTVKINGCKLTALADSGASINIISEEDYRLISSKVNLQDSNAHVFAYATSNPIPIIGRFLANLEYNETACEAFVHVTSSKVTPILSWKTSQALNLIKTAVNTVEQGQDPKLKCTTEFKDIFEGLGKLKDAKATLHIDKAIPPQAQRHRRIPFHVRKQLESQIKKDLELGVIEKATGPTPWVSPLVVVPKPKSPGSIRVCVDMRAPNQAIRRERHATPTLDEITTILNGSKVFSKLDLNQGYNQVVLDEDSRYITTFSTHIGLYRYRRLNFGVNSAAEIFQDLIRQALLGLPGVINISDDILVFSQDTKAHEEHLKHVFMRLRDKGLTLNKEKCEFFKSNIEFLGHIFGAEGIKPSPTKLQTILNLPTPKNASEVRSLLGMMNFCGSKFIPNYATLTHDIRVLTQNRTPFNWTSKQDKALDKLKNLLCQAPCLTYYNPHAETHVFVDASPVGLCAILTQPDDMGNHRVIQYASRSLTEVEQRYSQTEREALAITWACEHLHIYLFGTSFTVHTDHKPLLTIFGNPKANLPTRIERWVMRTQGYQMNVVYRKGEDNPADYLSRHPIHQTTSSQEQKIADEYVQYIIDNSIPKAMTLEQVLQESTNDITHEMVRSAICTGKWETRHDGVDFDRKTYKTLQLCKSELSLSSSGLILKGRQIVVPKSLQTQAISLAHTGHQGIVKTIALLREKVWFENMHNQVEAFVKACHHCQISTPTFNREPLKMSPLPSHPWSELSIDFGHLPNGQYLLVVTDEYSRYPIVDILQDISANTVIPRLDKILSEFGIPDSIKTDNGPPFTSYMFKMFLTHHGIKHRKITPLWPRANAETERFMRTIKKTLKAAHATHRNYKQEMYKFLLSYRATPHCTTGVPPAKLLFGRNIKTVLPESRAPLKDEDLRRRDTMKKATMKRHADAKLSVKPSAISVGDPVLLKNSSLSKSSTPYNPSPYIVTARKGSMVTAERGNKSVTRNSSFFKPSPRFPNPMEEEREDSNIFPDGEAFRNGPAENEITHPPPTPQAEQQSSPTVVELPRSLQRTQTNTQTVTRSGRVVKLPTRYTD